jgi:2-polyprenyl-6-methoxyphenol hydroxylase-like FAD-dependent oxidoreductase
MQGQSVLISGAGIAGPALAAWLHAADFRPVLVERSSSPRPGGYVIDFWGLGYVIAQRMGLLSEINRLGYHLRALRIVDARGKTVSGFDARVMSELTGGRFVTIARSDLARVLLDHSGASTEVIFGDEIVALQQDAGGVDVNFLHASPRRFDLVIGADGLHSGVRRSVFGPDARFEKKLGYVAAAFEISGYRPREQETYVIYAQPGRMVGRFALHEDRTLILFVLSAEQNMDLATLDLSAQKQFLRARFGADAWELPRILCELTDSTDLYFDRVSQIRMERWSSGRVALLGDAAACISLTGGQGSALAIIAAYILAGELARSAPDYASAFHAYEDRLRKFIAAKQRGAERFAAAFAPKTRSGLWFRNTVLRATAIPGVARLSLSRDITDRLELPQYVWSGPISRNDWRSRAQH